MAGDDKTERATAKRRDEARKEGNVLRSQEIGNAFAMAAGFGVLGIWGPHLWDMVQHDMVHRLKDLPRAGRAAMTPTDAMSLFVDILKLIGVAVGPIALGLMLVGIFSSVIQVKPQITISAIKPRFSKMNPIQGFKQKFGISAVFELVKNVLKLLTVGIPAGMIVWKQRFALLALGDTPPLQAGALAVNLTMKIGFRVAGIYVAIAVIDYMFQKYRYEKNLRMTKQEVKQEYRQQELAPEMKAAQRRRQREAARNRMMQDIPTADVVITNPTHYAVALKYDSELGAPQVVAKGVDLLALRIREIAEENGVQRFENRPLARELYASVEVGHTIPAEMFAAVAEVLAFVYRANERRRAAGEQVGARTSASSSAA